LCGCIVDREKMRIGKNEQKILNHLTGEKGDSYDDVRRPVGMHETPSDRVMYSQSINRLIEKGMIEPQQMIFIDCESLKDRRARASGLTRDVDSYTLSVDGAKNVKVYVDESYWLTHKGWDRLHPGMFP